jgi:hypothetical protein
MTEAKLRLERRRFLLTDELVATFGLVLAGQPDGERLAQFLGYLEQPCGLATL